MTSRSCCRCCGAVAWLDRIVRTHAAVNKSPMTPSATAGYPGLVLGTRLNSETAMTFVNASKAEAARTC